MAQVARRKRPWWCLPFAVQRMTAREKRRPWCMLATAPESSMVAGTWWACPATHVGVQSFCQTTPFADAAVSPQVCHFAFVQRVEPSALVIVKLAGLRTALFVQRRMRGVRPATAACTGTTSRRTGATSAPGATGLRRRRLMGRAGPFS